MVEDQVQALKSRFSQVFTKKIQNTREKLAEEMEQDDKKVAEDQVQALKPRINQGIINKM